MKITEQNSYRPVTIILETEEEAQELLGVLQAVEFTRPSNKASMELQLLRDTLHTRLGVPMAGLYYGKLTRSS